MKKKISTVLLFSILFVSGLKGQIQWSAEAGGGITYFERVMNDYPWPKYTGGPLFQAGASISSLFGKESMVGWEAGLRLVSGGYFYVPEKKDENGNDLGWDYSNKRSQRDWYIQMPVSLTFNMFEGTGFLLGARLNRRLTHLNKYTKSYRKWIPAAHLGIFTQITPRVRIDVTGFIDILERLDSETSFSPGLRDMGGSLNVRYQLN